MSSLKIPILLLKTKSIPNDGYEEHFSSPNSLFAPVFVPVLEHKPNITNLERVRTLLQEGELNRRYGGMIFTSQRAVEGFAQVVQELERGRNLTEDEKENILEGNEHSELGSSMNCLTLCCIFISLKNSEYLIIFPFCCFNYHVYTSFTLPVWYQSATRLTFPSPYPSPISTPTLHTFHHLFSNLSPLYSRSSDVP